MDDLAKVGISMKEVTDKLTDDGVKLFADAFDKLLAAVEKSRKSECTPQVKPADLQAARALWRPR